MRYGLIGLWKLIWGTSLWIGASLLLKRIMQFVRKEENGVKIEHVPADGYFLAGMFLLTSVICTISIQQLVAQSFLVGLQVGRALQI